ncbi:MAG: hypothetical protein EBU90_30800, partial [Proteobacteria bacterium]|nr:hypothetical protein [Pseudomonadota bacterium]
MVKMKAPAVVRAKSVDSTESAIRAQYKKIAELVTRKQQAESARARLRTLKEKATISTSSKYLKGKQVQLLKKMVRLKKPVA